ncbi:MAG: HesA/MoeB/ThiF family protein, partial [Succinivibrionaceae bacterium]|nr:HesA/MoeB/ThiF family protein [Succinivibrionaceae bacterium]
MPGTLGDGERGRYARNLAVREIGEAGQLRLRASRALVVGAGGLGSPAALYLAAAGVGEIVLVDDDMVELSNLQRQILHRTSRIGTPKAESGRLTLEALNPAIHVEARVLRMDRGNARALARDCDVAIEACDSLPAKYLLCDACAAEGRALCHGAVERFGGLAMTYVPGQPCWRCAFGP